MKKISQYFLIISMFLSVSSWASISVLTNGLPRNYKLEGKCKIHMGKDSIEVTSGKMSFEGADLKGGSFTFGKNSQNWDQITYKEGKLETKDGTFFVKGKLKQGRNNLDIIMRIYLEPIQDGFKMEVKYLSLDSKRKNSKFPVKEFKGTFKTE